MGFVRDLFGKETHQITLEDIKQLLSMRREEDRCLQYKSPDVLRDPEELSQCVSSFLNAEGGVIIIGLCEAKKTKSESLDQKIRAARVSFAPKEYTREKVEGLILANIGFTSRPPIRVYSVHNPRNVAKAIYLVEIPQGDDPPYQAADGKYYRRIGSTKYAMSHYEIGDLLARKKKPSLVLTSELIDVKAEDSSYRFGLRLFVANKGGATARYTQFTASFANAEIESIDKGNVLRSDDIRGGVPSIQWDCADRVLHPTGQRMLIADLRLRLLDNSKPCVFDYTLVAENVDLIANSYSFGEALLKEAKKKLEKGMAVFLTGEEAEEGEGG